MPSSSVTSPRVTLVWLPLRGHVVWLLCLFRTLRGGPGLAVHVQAVQRLHGDAPHL